MKCDFFENVLSRAETIHAAGDKWAGRGGPALPWPMLSHRCSATRSDKTYRGMGCMSANWSNVRVSWQKDNEESSFLQTGLSVIS